MSILQKYICEHTFHRTAHRHWHTHTHTRASGVFALTIYGLNPIDCTYVPYVRILLCLQFAFKWMNEPEAEKKKQFFLAFLRRLLCLPLYHLRARYTYIYIHQFFLLCVHSKIVVGTTLFFISYWLLIPLCVSCFEVNSRTEIIKFLYIYFSCEIKLLGRRFFRFSCFSSFQMNSSDSSDPKYCEAINLCKWNVWQQLILLSHLIGALNHHTSL